MKKVWICIWETVPGDGEHTEEFKTLAAAKKAMRQKITDSVDLQEYIDDLRQTEEADCGIAADFLEKYLTDADFPCSASDIPTDYDENDRCNLCLGTGYIDWDYRYGAYPRLHTNIVLDEVEGEDYEFHFWYEDPESLSDNQTLGLSIRIQQQTDYGTSAYPLMVLMVLDDRPQTQDEIINQVYNRYGTKIDRKAVGRHLKLLKELGCNVQHNKCGYYIPAE